MVFLEGVVGNNVKRGCARNGQNYITFSLCVNTYFKELHDTTEAEHGGMTYIRVFVYDQGQINYLNRVKVRHGQRASIFGRLNSAKVAIKGAEIIQLNVIVRDITITKTVDDYVYTDDEVHSMDVE